MKKAELQKLP